MLIYKGEGLKPLKFEVLRLLEERSQELILRFLRGFW